MSEPEIHVDPDTGVRYLDPIVYEPVMLNGKRIGWKVPDHERERWDNPPAWGSGAFKIPGSVPKSLQQLIVELETWVDMTPPLERQLGYAYELDPGRVSRIVQTVVAGAEAKRLTNPGGLLVTRLRELTTAGAPVEPEPEPEPVTEPQPDDPGYLAFLDTLELPEEDAAA